MVVTDHRVFSIQALDDVQNTGERVGLLLNTQSFGLGSGELLICLKRFLEGCILMEGQCPPHLQILRHIEVVNKRFRNSLRFFIGHIHAGCMNLCVGVFIGIITVNADTPMFQLIVDCGTVILETIVFHGSVHISLGSFFCLLQGFVVQLVIEAVFKMMICRNQIAAFRLFRFGADFLLDFFGGMTATQAVVPFITGKHFLKAGTVLCPEDWIG